MEVRKELEEILAQPDNGICADCGCSDPQWASISLGVFLCIECSGVHRGLGVTVSKVGFYCIVIFSLSLNFAWLGK